MDYNSPGGASVIVYSYNLLTHTFANSSSYPETSEEYLEPAHRHAKVIEKLNAAIAYHSCDLRIPQYPIFCFQECDYAWIDALQPYFSSLNYQFISSPYQYGSFGVAIAYPYTYLSTKCLIATPQHRLKMNWKVRNTWSGLLAKQNVRIALRLSPRKHPHQVFWVYTYHMPNLYTDPLAQYAMTVMVKRDILSTSVNEPIIIAGDFNILPDKDAFKLLTDPTHVPSESKCLPLTGQPGDYPSDFMLEELPCLKVVESPIYTIWTRIERTDRVTESSPDEFKGVLDYIFYLNPNNSNSSSKSITLGVQDVSSKLMPNKEEPSDHLMIGAIVNL